MCSEIVDARRERKAAEAQAVTGEHAAEVAVAALLTETEGKKGKTHHSPLAQAPKLYCGIAY